MSEQLDGWHWVEWRNTLEPELFRDGRIQDHDGDWIMPSPTRKIGPRIPTPEELKATELELAKLRNRVDDLYATFIGTQEERDRLRADNAKYLDMIQKMYWTAGLISDGDELEAVKRLREERDRLRADRNAIRGALNNLMARIFRDGGQRADAIGDDVKAATEADRVAVEMMAERDRLQAEVERLRPKEAGGWRFFNCFNPKSNFWAVREVGYGVWFDVSRRLWFNSQQTIEKRKNDGSPELSAHDAYARLDGWPEGQRKFRELTGYEPPTCKESLPVQPEERVRCYRSKSGGVWVYGVQHKKYFSSYGDWNTAQSESEQTTIKNGTRCTLSEARALLADRPKSLAEFDRITGRDEDREHLARLMAIPCKEMRV